MGWVLVMGAHGCEQLSQSCAQLGMESLSPMPFHLATMPGNQADVTGY